MARPRTSSTWQAWLQLVRVPNLPTVPGDPLAGAALAVACGASFVAWRVAVAGVSVLFLYMCGLLLNDWADTTQDAAERPRRPIPSGRVSRRAVLIAAGFCAVAGLGFSIPLGLAGVLTAVLILVLVGCYDFVTHRRAVAGFLNMGLCRAFSVLLGAVAVGWRPAGVDAVRIGAATALFYVATVTWIAHRETEARRLGALRFAPQVVVAGGFAWIALSGMELSVAFLALVLGVLLQLGRLSWRLVGVPEPAVVQRTVGDLIRTWVLVQAMLCALWVPDGPVVAVIPVALFALSTVLARTFYAS